MNAIDSEISIAVAAGTPAHVDKLRVVLNLCRRMRASTDLSSLQTLITREAKELLQADRVSVFLFDRDNCELWSAIAQEGKIMRFDARLGIAGAVAMSNQTINVADAYEHPLFYKEVDLQTGYRTRTLLAVPIHSLDGSVIGVGEATNKLGGVFTNEDAEILSTIAAHLTDIMENSPIAAEMKAECRSLAAESSAPWSNGFATQKIVGMSHRIQSIIRLIDQIRPSSVDVLIEGESGTGKELIAKALHFNSPRAKHPFVAINCAALPDNLVETELFGIEKGVATGVDRRIGKFEAAHGGTLFLDEIGDLSPSAQAKILRVLQERSIDRIGARAPIPVDVRIIAATNRNLESAMRDRLFREDLYYRLSVVRIPTPSLREIPEDIPILANHFLQKHCTANLVDSKHFTAAAISSMSAYSWPGNARQLENEVKRLVASVRTSAIDAAHLLLESRGSQANSISTPEQLSGQTLRQAVDALERQMIQQAIDSCAGNKAKAAQTLGLSRQGLIKKLQRLGVE
ncbi:MAG TPA: sigma-54-dependent Fis family transcriptional regulator [Candidatus Binatia bacterium]|nr:sigma-54-dependent Fis family transcriptional regulator [Candidatus Binatia bacterium]